ncbi:autotransporter outer membrane beta-barrel domain-containing protein [Hyphomicrobium sp.]|uniref:autotransporter family protein n=1 Tax=Hyphomicrobium sp. TaxID=82 RepID=UPI0025C1366A|nr:autotransporter outer membrane beta-barrel domain-containing protein [Hyphomicrobium sp.]
MSNFVRKNGLHRSHFTLVSLTAALAMGVSHQAMAAGSCTVTDPASGSLLCSGGVISTAITVYDAAAQFQPTNGSNSYTPNNPAFPPASNPDNPGYNPNPPTTVITIDNSASLIFTNPASLPDKGIIAANFSNAENPAVNNVEIDNYGIIALSYNLFSSRMHAIVADSQVNDFVVNNYAGGNISATQTGTPGALTVTSSGSPATNSARQGGAALNIVSAIYTDDNTNSLTVNNDHGANISATGSFAAAIYGRADTTINNSGFLGSTSWSSSDNLSAGHWAVGTYAGAEFDALPGSPNPDSPFYNVTNIVGGVGQVIVTDTAATTITNNANGTIKGDILVLDTNPLVTTAGGASAPNGFFLPAPYAVSGTNSGPRDSNITNAGEIDGNFYLGSGAHVIQNLEHATISGNINVDQWNSVGSFLTAVAGTASGTYQSTGTGTDSHGNACPTAGSNTTDLNCAKSTNALAAFHGDRSFTLENAGTLNGNVTVRTATTNGDEVTVAPHIFGNGALSANSVIDSRSGFIGGTLKVWDGTNSSLEATTTITPILDATVKDGQWYTVATGLFGTSANTVLAGLNVEGSALLDWSAQTNSTNELVIGASVRDAFDVAGISKPGASTINALIDAGGNDPTLDQLGAAVESLPTDAAVAKAAKQLAPETNFATQQSAITLNNAIGQHIDTRLSAVGATGASPQTAFAKPYGLVAQQAVDPNRSNLGGSLKDGDDDFVVPRSAALWGQAFGAGMNQNSIDNVDGYNARLYGIIAGYDNWISPGVRVGIAGGYANTSIDGEGDTVQNRTGIDSYLVEAYGALKREGWYATARTGFTWHNYDTTRVLTVPYSDVAKGSHDGDQFNASIEVGAPMQHAGTIITPVASLTYSHLHQDAYTESSDGGMALGVDGQTNNSLVSGLGLKGLVPIANDTVIEGRALWLHEFGDDAQSVTASFAAGGGTFTAAGPGVGRDTADLGVGMLAQIGPNSAFQLNYDANVRQDYLAHVGSARIDINF